MNAVEKHKSVQPKFTFLVEDQNSSPEPSPKESSKKDLPAVFSSVVTKAPKHPYALPSCGNDKIIVDPQQKVMFCQNGKAISLESTMPTVYLTNFKVKNVVRFITQKGALSYGTIIMCKNSKIGNLKETEKYATINIVSDSPVSRSSYNERVAVQSNLDLPESDETIAVLPDTPMAESH